MTGPTFEAYLLYHIAIDAITEQCNPSTCLAIKLTN